MFITRGDKIMITKRKRLVLKFGGTSVMDTERISKVAKIVMDVASQGFEVVVVVSAMGHTTDHLIDLAEHLQTKPDAREMDVLMTTGEQVSAALMAIAIQAAGGKAKSFTGARAGIFTEKSFGSARIRSVNPLELESCLSQGTIPVVAGFQGITEDGELTTLGRGGSDTTAIALAARLNAERCDIYSDVNGVYSADPRLLDIAYRLDAISYAEMLELALNGTQVLNARSVEIAMHEHVPVRVRSTFEPENEGTLVTNSASQINPFTGISCETQKYCIKMTLPAPDHFDKNSLRAFRHKRFFWKKRIQRLLAEAGVNIEIGNSLKNFPNELAFAINKADIEVVRSLLKVEEIEVAPSIAKLSIVSCTMTSASEVEAITSLTKAGISILLETRGHFRVSLFVPEEKRLEAIRILHANFCALVLAA
jgi:aspartate kinase